MVANLGVTATGECEEEERAKKCTLCCLSLAEWRQSSLGGRWETWDSTLIAIVTTIGALVLHGKPAVILTTDLAEPDISHSI